MIGALKDPTGGAGAKPLLGSANTVQRASTGGEGAKDQRILFGVRLG